MTIKICGEFEGKNCERYFGNSKAVKSALCRCTGKDYTLSVSDGKDEHGNVIYKAIGADGLEAKDTDLYRVDSEDFADAVLTLQARARARAEDTDVYRVDTDMLNGVLRDIARGAL